MGAAMSSSKSKNIIIIILLLLDVFLFSIVIADKIEAARVQREQEEAICRVLAMNGIELSENISLDMSAPVPCTISRDAESELSMAGKMLGKCNVNDLGGNIIHYTSGRGQAMIRGNGELSIIFSGDRPDMEVNAKSASKLMSRYGIELSRDGAFAEGSDITLRCTLDGYSVYNATLTFTVAGDSLSMVNGTCVFGGERSDSSENVMDSATAMMRFLEIVRDEGFICSRIDTVEAGYFLSVSVSGISTLSPVWHISTDTGELYINAVSGKIENMAA